MLSLIWVNFPMLPRTLNKNTKKIKEKYIHETIIRTGITCKKIPFLEFGMT